MAYQANPELLELEKCIEKLPEIKEELRKHQKYLQKLQTSTATQSVPEDIVKTCQDVQSNALGDLTRVQSFLFELYETKLPTLIANWEKQIEAFDEKLCVVRSDYDYESAVKEYETLSSEWTKL